MGHLSQPTTHTHNIHVLSCRNTIDTQTLLQGCKMDGGWMDVRGMLFFFPVVFVSQEGSDAEGIQSYPRCPSLK